MNPVATVLVAAFVVVLLVLWFGMIVAVRRGR